VPQVWGTQVGRRDLLRVLGSLEQLAEVRLLTVENGIERGNRILQFRAAALTFDVHLDRGFDIGRCDFHGVPVGFRGQAGFPLPGVAGDRAGLDALRAWGGGLVMTGGLDHVFGPATSSAAQFHYPHRREQVHPMHGRVWLTAADLRGHGAEWRGEDLVLYAEGEVRQASAFGENLVLRRRIEAEVGSGTLRLDDTVTNEGAHVTSHMYLYHVNVGAPLAWPGATIGLPFPAGTPIAGTPDVDYRTLPEPVVDESERVFHHRLGADTGEATVSVHNRQAGLRLEARFNARDFPHFLVWQGVAPGGYGLGLEPATNDPFGRDAAAERGELRFLEPGESRGYGLRLRFALVDPETAEGR
jgi:hypothetical protein